MKLLVDIGNTALKWMRLGPAGLESGGSLAWRDADLDARLDHAWGALTAPAAVVVASVAGPAPVTALNAWCERRWGRAAWGSTAGSP